MSMMPTLPTLPTVLAPRRLLLLPVLALVLALASACGLPHFAQGQWSGSTSDGAVQVIDPAKRSEPVSLSGDTLEGKPLSLASTRGKVTVVSVWGSWCTDCIQEAEQIQAAHRRLGAAVPFVGIDIRDTSRKNALSFQRGNAMTFPSIYAPDGAVLLDFKGLSPDTIPATLILDRQGRIATIIGGKIPDTLTLVEAVQDVEHGTHGA